MIVESLYNCMDRQAVMEEKLQIVTRGWRFEEVDVTPHDLISCATCLRQILVTPAVPPPIHSPHQTCYHCQEIVLFNCSSCSWGKGEETWVYCFERVFLKQTREQEMNLNFSLVSVSFCLVLLWEAGVLEVAFVIIISDVIAITVLCTHFNLH